MSRLFVGLFVLFVGCATAPIAAVRDARWEGPVVVVADPSMPECAQIATRSAVAWWVSRGEPINLIWSSAAPLLGASMPVPGTVVVDASPPSKPDSAAETDGWHRGDKMIAAYVHTGGVCSSLVIAHELGHALGWLRHSPSAGRLMSRYVQEMTWSHP